MSDECLANQVGCGIEVLRGPERSIKNLERISVVIGAGMSDIGKGWTTAAIASMAEHPMVIKIDPMQNKGFPTQVGVVRGGVVVTEDVETYEKLGINVLPEHNIVMGQAQRAYFAAVEDDIPMIRPGEEKKQTCADFSYFLAKLMADMMSSQCPSEVVIEIGGIASDLEHTQLPGALRALGIMTGVMPELVELSYFDHREVEREGMSDGQRLATQIIREGIRTTMGRYAGLGLRAALVRKRRVPDSIEQSAFIAEAKNCAYETQIESEKMVFVDNVSDVAELRDVLSLSPVFKRENRPLWMSACMMGMACRYDGTSRQTSLDVNEIIAHRAVEVACPELLAGLGVPRGPFELKGGGGAEVLKGEAQVIDKDGVDVTPLFVQGALRALESARRVGVKQAIMKRKSPSCSPFDLKLLDGTLRDGMGVTAALFLNWGIEVLPSSQYKL